MIGFTAKCIVLLIMLLSLPLLGIYAAHLPIARYLEFPPRTIYISHAPFSWPVFMGYIAAIVPVVFFFLFHFYRARNRGCDTRRRPAISYPWWGWLGIATGVASWVLAWSRFDWFAEWQSHTFTPLWLSFIVVMNALTYSRTGHCMLKDRSRLFLLLFPASAVFWWFFEYLNRFVQNWHYLGPDRGALEYFLLATLPFSTVLPAVLSVREWMMSFRLVRAAFENSIPLRPAHPRLLAGVVLACSAAGLTGIGVFPNYLFPLLWISPGLIIVSLQTLQGERHILSDIVKGYWTPAAASALAALFCGLFWEMWNYYSLAKWEYLIPFVNRFHLFEMPILGYAGYLPFGLECAVIGDFISGLLNDGKR